MRQKGFTLVEVLVVMAVGGILMTGIVVGIFQVFWGTSRSTSQVTALTDIDRAALAIKKDLMMTQSTNLADNSPIPQSSVTLTWTDYSGWASTDSNHSSSYALSGTNLVRTYDGVSSNVSRYITSVGFTRNGGFITVIITATGYGAQQRNATLKFSALTRAGAIPQ